MSELVRFTVSIEQPLFEQLENLVESSEYANRSEFIRDLIRSKVVAQEWQTDKVLLGTISILYDHHARGLSERLIHHQHHFCGSVMATTHVHLDEHLCAEMIMVRGRGKEISALVDRLGREKGVYHSSLAAGTTGDAVVQSEHGSGAHHKH
ncbi:MAG: nickel-responsive transcriptional regulator NikR [Planctomycetes bacterium]|nr:nickel-responsive transcriptional regulator NikR [Planctomycetota bacterium]